MHRLRTSCVNAPCRWRHRGTWRRCGAHDVSARCFVNWRNEALQKRLAVAPLSPQAALGLIADLMDDEVPSVEVTSSILARCVDVFVGCRPARTSVACVLSSSFSTSPCSLTPLCIAVMQRVLRHRTFTADSLAAGSAFNVHHVVASAAVADTTLTFPVEETPCEKAPSWPKALSTESLMLQLVALEKPLLDVVCASLGAFLSTDPLHDYVGGGDGEWLSSANMPVVCATVLLFAESSTISESTQTQRCLRRYVRAAVQRVFASGAPLPTCPTRAAESCPTSKALGQYVVFLSELLLRLGPSLGPLTVSEGQDAESAQWRLLREVERVLICYHDSVRTLIQDEQPPQTLGVATTAASSTHAHVRELIWHTRLMTSLIARVPVGVPVTGITDGPAETEAVASAYVPIALMSRIALDAAATACTSSAWRDDGNGTKHLLWEAIVQIAFSVVLHRSLTDAVGYKPHHAASCADTQTAPPDLAVAWECVALLEMLYTERAVRTGSQTAWVQLAAVLHCLGSHRDGAPAEALTTVTALQATLLHDGLALVLPLTTSTSPTPTRLLLVSLLRSWTSWMPSLLEHHTRHGATSLASVVALMRVVEPTVACRAAPTVRDGQHSAAAPRRRGDDRDGFPVLRRGGQLSSSVSSTTPARAQPLRAPSPLHAPHNAHSLARRLEEALVMLWNRSLPAHCVNAVDEDELLEYVLVLDQVSAERALLAHALPTNGSAAAFHCMALIPAASCALRLRHQTMTNLTSLAAALPRRVLPHAAESARRGRRLAPACSVLLNSCANVLPDSRGCTVLSSAQGGSSDASGCVSREAVGVCIPRRDAHYVPCKNDEDDRAVGVFRGFVNLVRPSGLDETLDDHHTCLRRDGLAVTRVRGVHASALSYGLCRTAGGTVWGWCLARRCGCVVDPTCHARLLTATSLIWQHRAHAPPLSVCASTTWCDHAAARRLLQPVVWRPSLVGSATSAHVATWSVSANQRQAALGWFIRQVDEGHREVAARQGPRRLVYEGTWLTPSALTSPCADRSCGALVAVRCAFWDLSRVWEDLCDAHAWYQRARLHKRAALSRYTHSGFAHLTTALESLYTAWHGASRLEESWDWLADDDDDDTPHHTVALLGAGESVSTLDLTLNQLNDAAHAPDSGRDVSTDCPSPLCEDTLAVLLHAPGALALAKRVPLSFAMRLFQRCVVDQPRWTSAAPSTGSLDTWCTWLLCLELIAAVRALHAHLSDPDSLLRDGTPRAPCSHLDALDRCAAQLRAVCCDEANAVRTAPFLARASQTFWTEQPLTWPHSALPLHAVVLHTLLEERAAVGDVVLALKHAKARVGDAPPDGDDATHDALEDVRGKLLPLSRRAAAAL